MTNLKTIEITNPDGSLTEHIIIDWGNDEFTSMPKSVYDEMIAQQEQSTENPTA